MKMAKNEIKVNLRHIRIYCLQIRLDIQFLELSFHGNAPIFLFLIFIFTEGPQNCARKILQKQVGMKLSARGKLDGNLNFMTVRFTMFFFFGKNCFS